MGFRVRITDKRGTSTERPRGEPFKTKEQAQDLLFALKTLGLNEDDLFVHPSEFTRLEVVER